MRHGESPKSDRVEQCENGGVGADRDAERENDDDGEQGILRELPKGEAKVASEIVEKGHQAVTIPLLSPVHPDPETASGLKSPCE